MMANSELFSIRVRRPTPLNRTIIATSTDTITEADGYNISSNIPTVKKKVKRTRKKFNVTLSSTKETDLKNLKCSFCHDIGALTDTVICSGMSGHCKAVYHKECWDEKKRYGGAGCKVMGCGSTSFAVLTNKKKAKKKKSTTTSSSMVFCLTGRMTKRRTEITKIITDNGGSVASSMSKKVRYLVCGEGCNGTSKHTRAMSLHTPTLSEEDLYVMLGIIPEATPELVFVDGYGRNAGYEIEYTYVKCTPTLVVLVDDDGETLRYSRETGLPTPATKRLIGEWKLSEAALTAYGVITTHIDDDEWLFEDEGW